jgi:hypothetical protein
VEQAPRNFGHSECLLFLHIPKAAGNTLKGILASLYPAEQIYRIDGNRIRESNEALAGWSEAQLQRLKVVMGHMKFGIHRVLPMRCRYITILREPVSRIVSHYYFVRRSVDHYLHRFVIDNHISLIDYATAGLSTELDNGQVRMLAGIEDEPARLFRSPDLRPGMVPWGHCTSEHLQQAMTNLTTHFEVVGLHDRFDESLQLMNERFGWNVTSYEHRNITRGRPALAQIDSATREAIQSVNALDAELYDYASRRLAIGLARCP